MSDPSTDQPRDGFYEDDENPDDVHAAFERGEKNRTAATTIERTFPAARVDAGTPTPQWSEERDEQNRQQCQICGKWQWPFLHSCSGVRPAAGTPTPDAVMLKARGGERLNAADIGALIAEVERLRRRTADETELRVYFQDELVRLRAQLADHAIDGGEIFDTLTDAGFAPKDYGGTILTALQALIGLLRNAEASERGLRAQRQAALDLHRPEFVNAETKHGCHQCGIDADWPCPTAAALGATE